jgi:glycerol-3-phosphate dehydrogenase
VGDVIAGTRRNLPARVRLVKGSHIVVPRLYEGEHAYLLQNNDRRVVFTIPYEQDFTLIGTTDVAWTGDASGVAIDPEETRYLCACVSRWLARPVTPDDVVWSFSGVRSLYDDGAEDASAVTRDYVLERDGEGEVPPLLSVFGGKITTYRRLAEHALEKLGVRGASWTAGEPLPGGDMGGDFASWFAQFRARHAWLPEKLARRLARAYGTRADLLLGAATSLRDLGEDLGGGLTEAELAYLVAHEFARAPEDVLWRRSKLGLHAPPAAADRLAKRREMA